MDADEKFWDVQWPHVFLFDACSVFRASLLAYVLGGFPWSQDLSF